MLWSLRKLRCWIWLEILWNKKKDDLELNKFAWLLRRSWTKTEKNVSGAKMKTPYFKKIVDSAGNEWVDSQDIFSIHWRTWHVFFFFNKWYPFIVKKCEQLNYYNNHTSTAYSNPDLSRLIGFCSGWVSARGCYEDLKYNVCYIKDSRDKTIMKFDVPKISETERENRKKIDKFWRNIRWIIIYLW